MGLLFTLFAYSKNFEWRYAKPPSVVLKPSVSQYLTRHDLEPERFVSTLGVEGIQPGVGGHLCATLISSPVLGRGNKFCSDSSPLVWRRNILSLDVSYWARRVATIRV
jgi:hypothetical protein